MSYNYYLGATLLAIFSALSGKYLSELGLYIFGLNVEWQVKIAWWVVFISAFIGTYSHVLIDKYYALRYGAVLASVAR